MGSCSSCSGVTGTKDPSVSLFIRLSVQRLNAPNDHHLSNVHIRGAKMQIAEMTDCVQGSAFSEKTVDKCQIPGRGCRSLFAVLQFVQKSPRFAVY